MKPVHWIGSSHKDLCRMPEDVRSIFGYGLYLAQVGDRHESAKALKGFGSAAVLELIEDDDGNAYRAVYTVQFRQAIYVLHCFQKKSRQGIATPQPDLDLIKRRLAMAKRAAEQEEL